MQDGIREWGIGNGGKGVGNAGYRRGEMERELGMISGTYYFRSTKEVFKAEIMQDNHKREDDENFMKSMTFNKHRYNYK